MDKKIKFVWDFFGLDSEKTATHSLHHLEEFLIKSNISIYSKGVFKQSDSHFYSFIVLDISHLEYIKLKLSPNRAFFIE